MIADIAEIEGTSATRFGLLLEAARRGNKILVAEMLLSIPATDLLAIEQRLSLFDINLRDLMRGQSA